MEMRGKAAFSTALRGKTAIWPGDVVRHNIEGVYIWRPGDTTLEKPQGDRYLIKNPGMLSVTQMGNIARDFASTLGLIMELPVTEAITLEAGAIEYQLGEKK